MKNYDRYLVPLFILILVDVAVLGGSILLAYQLRFSDWFVTHVWPTPIGSPSPLSAEYYQLSIYTLAIGLIIFERFGFYSHRNGLDRGFRPVSLLLAIIVCYVFLMAWLFLYVHASYAYSRLVIFLAMIVTFGFGLTAQVVLRYLMRALASTGMGFARTIVVASAENCQNILERLHFAHGSLHQIIGVVSTSHAKPEGLKQIPALGTVTELPRLLDRYKEVDRIILAYPLIVMNKLGPWLKLVENVRSIAAFHRNCSTDSVWISMLKQLKAWPQFLLVKHR